MLGDFAASSKFLLREVGLTACYLHSDNNEITVAI